MKALLHTAQNVRACTKDASILVHAPLTDGPTVAACCFGSWWVWLVVALVAGVSFCVLVPVCLGPCPETSKCAYGHSWGWPLFSARGLLLFVVFVRFGRGVRLGVLCLWAIRRRPRTASCSPIGQTLPLSVRRSCGCGCLFVVVLCVLAPGRRQHRRRLGVRCPQGAGGPCWWWVLFCFFLWWDGSGRTSE